MPISVVPIPMEADSAEVFEEESAVDLKNDEDEEPMDEEGVADVALQDECTVLAYGTRIESPEIKTPIKARVFDKVSLQKLLDHIVKASCT